MGTVIDCKKIAKEIKDDLKVRVDALKERGITPKLVVIQVGNNESSNVYIKGKEKDCEYVGIDFVHMKFDESVEEDVLLEAISCLNYTYDVSGIIVQLPLPEHIDEKAVMNQIYYGKDVDGFSPESIWSTYTGNKNKGYKCCTPAGIVELLKRSGVELEGKECVVIGRSNHVGKQTAVLLTEENATVTLAHSKTKSLKEITKRADVVVVAMGKPKFITSEYLKDGAIVIDVGIHRNDDGKLCGDVDFDDVINRVDMITPVPGGVGLMTRAMLLSNCVLASEK